MTQMTSEHDRQQQAVSDTKRPLLFVSVCSNEESLTRG